MHRTAKLAGALLLAVGVVGCDTFITGPGLTENPNQPIVATPSQLFVAAQASQFVRSEGQLARLASMYVQQLAGTNNQQLDYGSNYLFTENNVSQHYNGIYIGGGLVDLRKIQEASRAAGDAQFEGIAKVWEAYVIGMAASMWGDLPYREAVAGVAAPKLDPQQQIYEDVQKLLDNAIQLLAGAGPGPGAADLVYGGNVARWTGLAYTLKARFHLHTAERLGNAAYQAALTAAQNGINEAPSATAAIHGQGLGDFRAFHENELEKANVWAQFLQARQDMVAGKAMVDLLIARNDPRLAAYFDPATGTTFRGADQFGATGGLTMSEVNRSARRAFTFRQPFATWAENELILAEAKFRLGDATALTHVNNVRKAVGLAELAGPVTLAQIMEEKYITQFQNIDSWNDYKRTCLPALIPGGKPAAAEIPGRVVYGLSERQNNPNIPLPSNQPARNWNDPTACT